MPSKDSAGDRMTARPDALFRWSPRILGTLVCLFLSLFALDAFGGGRTFGEALPDYLRHVAPAAILLGVIALSWRREWIGGLVFTGVAAGYAYLARDHVTWIAVISGPLLAVGVLFWYSWLHRRHAHA
jgi:hypothetical protein